MNIRTEKELIERLAELESKPVITLRDAIEIDNLRWVLCLDEASLSTKILDALIHARQIIKKWHNKDHDPDFADEEWRKYDQTDADMRPINEAILIALPLQS